MPCKTLLLLRHAKSSWKNPQLDDHDRPLNSRGRTAAAQIGRLLQAEELRPDLVLCSTALRTRETADLVFAGLAPSPEIIFREDLYHADPRQITRVISQVDVSAPCLMLLGHNPGLEEFLSQITGEELPLPTAALARLELELSEWREFNPSTRGRLDHLWRPRELDFG